MIEILIVNNSHDLINFFHNTLKKEDGFTIAGTNRSNFFSKETQAGPLPDFVIIDSDSISIHSETKLKNLLEHPSQSILMVSRQNQHNNKVQLQIIQKKTLKGFQSPAVYSFEKATKSKFILSEILRAAYTIRKASAVLSTTTHLPNKELSIKESKKCKPIIRTRPSGKKKLILLGASAGGTKALLQVLKTLPATMPPILIVQHMPKAFTFQFAQRLNSLCALQVEEARNNTTIQPGHVYIAPGGMHMKVKQVQSHLLIKTDTEPAINGHRPSVDALFFSINKTLAVHTTAVVLTGMGSDGAKGMLQLFNNKAFTIAQDESSSAVFGMPKQAISLGAVHKILPLNEIAQTLYNVTILDQN